MRGLLIIGAHTFQDVLTAKVLGKLLEGWYALTTPDSVV